MGDAVGETAPPSSDDLAPAEPRDGLAISDCEENLLFVSDRLRQRLGYTADELQGKPLRTLFAAEGGEPSELPQQSCPQCGGSHRWSQLRCKDGGLLPIALDRHPLDDASGRSWGTLNVLINVAEKARQQNARQENAERRRATEARLRAINEAVQDAILMMDADGKAIHCNPAAERMFGYTAAEMLGREVHSLLVPPRLREKVRRGIDEYRRTGEGPVIGGVVQSTAMRKDGSEFPAEITVSPIQIDGGQAAVGTVRDITDRRLAEEAVRDEQRRLARLLDVYESHRRMATYEIHDGVAQPLVSALMILEGFSQACLDCPDAAWTEFETATGILREVLTQARRFMSGMRPPLLDELGVVAAIDHLVREWRVSAHKMIEFECDLPFDRLAPPLETAVYRIVQEALVNACKHSRSDRIRVELRQKDVQLKIVVRDWGIGFEPARVPRGCFGLEGIRERARVLGGDATVQSVSGEGTQIRAELPCFPEGAEGTSTSGEEASDSSA